MSADYEKSLGRKIAFTRKRRVSQEEFAAVLDLPVADLLKY